MLVTIFRGVKFKIEILKAKMIMKVAKIGISKKMYIIDRVYYYINTILYFIIFSDLPIFATVMIILAFKISILNLAPLEMVTSIDIYYK